MARSLQSSVQTLAFAALAITVLAFLGSLLAPMLISGEMLKSALITAAKESSGMTLTIEGDAHLSVFPSPSVTYEGVTAEPGSPLLNRTPLGIREVTMEIPFTGLASPVKSMTKLSLVAPYFFVERINADELEWDEFLNGGKKDPAKQEAMWRALYTVCRPKEDSATWIPKAQGLLKVKAPDSQDESLLGALTAALCPETADTRFVLFNWQLAGDPPTAGATGTAASRFLQAMFALAPETEIRHASVVYRAQNEEFRRDMINVTLSNNGSYAVDGTLEGPLSSVAVKFRADGTEDGSATSVSLTSEGVFSADFEGAFTGGAAQYKGTAEVQDMATFLAMFAEEGAGIPAVFGGTAQLTGAMTWNANNGLELKDIAVTSDVIKGKFNAGFSFGDSAASDLSVRADADVEMLDWDLLIERPKEKEEEGEDASSSTESADDSNNSEDDGGAAITEIHFSLPKLYSLKLDAHAKQIKVRHKEITDFNIQLDAFDNRASLNRLEFGLPGNGVFELSGFAEHNGIRPLFTGNMTVNGKKLRETLKMLMPSLTDLTPTELLNDYAFKAAVRMTPVSLALENALLTFDNASLRGSLGVDYIDANAAVYADVFADRLDFDLYNLTPAMLHGMYRLDKTSLADGNELAAVIRNFGKQMRFRCKAEDARFNKHNIRRAELNFSSAPGRFTLEKFNVEDNENVKARKFDIAANGLLEATETDRPKMSLNVSSEYLDTDIFRTDIPLSALPKDFFPPDPVPAQPETPAANENTASKRKERIIPYMFFDKFDGPTKISLNRIFIKGEMPISNLYLQARTENGLLYTDEARASLFEDGKALARGTFSLGPLLSAGVSLAAQNLHLERLYELLPSKWKSEADKKITGNLSLTVKGRANGENWKRLMEQADLTGDFSLTDFTVDGVDFEKMGYAAANTISVTEMKSAIEKGFSSGVTAFTGVKGNIATNKAKKPYQVQLKDVNLNTESSKSVYAANMNLADGAMSSVLRMMFRSSEGKPLMMSVTSVKDSTGKTNRQVDDKALMDYIASKTEGLE